MTLSENVIRVAEIKNDFPRCLDQLVELYQSCTKWLNDRGMHHWDDSYTREILDRLLQREITMFSILEKYGEGELIIGNVFIEPYLGGKRAPKWAKKLQLNFWTDNNANAVYVFGLAVSPNFMGNNYGEELLKKVESFARSKNIRYIRLDIVDGSNKLPEWYEQKGFKNTQQSRVSNGITCLFMEKELEY